MHGCVDAQAVRQPLQVVRLSAIANDRQLAGKAIYVEVSDLDIADASGEGNRTLAVCIVTATIVYRVGVSDVTT